MDRQGFSRIPSGISGRGGRYAQPRHLSAVLPAVSAAIGIPVSSAVHTDPEQDREILGIPHAASVVVVLIDGLGFHNLYDRRGHAPYLRSLMLSEGNDRPVSTCFPSTTAVAMGTFGTGTCPGLTSITGYTQLNPSTGRIAQMLSFLNAPDPRELQVQPTVFEQLSRQSVRVTAVGLPKFKKSSLTAAALRGSDYRAGRTPGERIREAAFAGRTPGVTYIYIPDVDAAGHHYGLDSSRWTEALEKADRQLAILRQNLPAGTCIIITADHGMINADPGSRTDIAENPVLWPHVSHIGGEPRNVMLYAEGRNDQERLDNARKIYHAYSGFMEGRADVYLKEEAISQGFYGYVSTEAYAVIGDVIVVPRGNATLVDSRFQEDSATRLPSVHGGATGLETDIPLLIDVI